MDDRHGCASGILPLMNVSMGAMTVVFPYYRGMQWQCQHY